MSNANNTAKKKAKGVEPWREMMRIANVDPALTEPIPDGRMILDIPIDQIRPSPQQARTQFNPEELEELAASIKKHGVLQPIKVISRSEEDPHFELVYGERRWRACQQAKLATIPAIVVSADEVDEKGQAIQGLIENLQRADLSPLDTLKGLENLQQLTGASWNELAQLTGKSNSAIYRFRDLSKLPVEVQEMVRTGELNLHQATSLVRLEKTQAQTELARLAVTDNLPGDALQEIVKSIQTGEKVETAIASTVRHRGAEERKPDPIEETDAAPQVEDEQEPSEAEENTSGMSFLHRGIMKGLPEQQFEDLAFQIDAHQLTLPETRAAVAIMEDNPVISASAAVTYVRLLTRTKLFQPLRKVDANLTYLQAPLHGKLTRGVRTAALSWLRKQAAKAQELVAILQQMDEEAKNTSPTGVN